MLSREKTFDSTVRSFAQLMISNLVVYYLVRIKNYDVESPNRYYYAVNRYYYAVNRYYYAVNRYYYAVNRYYYAVNRYIHY
jgi:hypothetical protein